MAQNKANGRHGTGQSVCRQCFRTCDSAAFNSAFCFGSITGGAGNAFTVDFASSASLITQTTPHARGDWTGVLGIPTWMLVDATDANDATARTAITTTASNVFVNNVGDGKSFAGGMAAGNAGNGWGPMDMTYWSIIAADSAWWSSDLKAKQDANVNGQSSGCAAGTPPAVYATCSHGDLLTAVGGL